ncbi:uncharacterized protein [Ranitomeya imitator]|uniref:uncharacterized protein n=1 Tax=Ranitomeya imitator TaxID=111125 RepID=UPI0037E89EB5
MAYLLMSEKSLEIYLNYWKKVNLDTLKKRNFLSFFNAVCHEVQSLKLDPNKGRNLNRAEQKAIVRLGSNRDFVIREADKGGNLVIWPTELYLNEVKLQLSNSECYQVLPSDPTDVFRSKLDRLLDSAFTINIINKREREFMTNRHPRVPTFYLIPKVHKSVETPPGRPIVSGLGGLLERPCTYVDFFLQPLVSSLDSFVRDSTFLIQQLQTLRVPPGVWLVTLDVEALYTCIGHDLGTQAVAFFLDQNTTGTLEECHQFVDTLNQNPWNIRLTSHFSQMEVEFLDLKLYPGDGYVQTTLYRKPTAINSLLHFSSFHPQHLKKGIPKGQFYRIRRNCSTQEDFRRHSQDLTQRFKNRGYPRKVIANAYSTAKEVDRGSLLQPRQKTAPRPLGVITTFNNQWQEVRGILTKYWGILCSEPKLKPHISERPSLIARRPKNLKDCLSHSHFKRQVTRLNRGIRLTGTFPCGNCSICPFIGSNEMFFSSLSPSLQMAVKTYFNCKSRNLVYALICPCPKTYVGQTTQELKRRIQQHLSTITTAKKDLEKGKTLSSVASHFLSTHNSQSRGIKIVGLESVQPDIRGGDITLELLRRESKWIFNLNSQTPFGLNEDLLFTGFYKQS